MLWRVAAILLIIWSIGWIIGKGSMWHIFLLCAIGVGFVQLVADWRTSQK
jgi:hypothetical protein